MGGHGRGKGKEKAAVVQSSESESDALSDIDMLAPRHSPTSPNAVETSRPRHQQQIPSCFPSNSESEENDGTIVFSVSIMTQKGYQEA